jgi:hypothetical protein
MMAIDRKKIEELTQNLFQRWKTDADRLGEEDTKTNYIEPVLKCLGWDLVENTTSGEGNSAYAKNPDYVLRANNVNYLVVEAKALQHRLDLKDAERAQENALHANANWCLVTEGYFYKVYNRNWDIGPKERLFFKTSLTEATEDFSRFLYKMNLISKQSMTGGKIDELGRVFYRRKKIQKLLTEPPEELVQVIEGLDGYDLEEEEVKESLKELKYNEFNIDTCPLCQTRERCELEFSERLEDKGISRDQFMFLPFISIERFESLEAWKEHMLKNHPEVLNPLL